MPNGVAAPSPGSSAKAGVARSAASDEIRHRAADAIAQARVDRSRRRREPAHCRESHNHGSGHPCTAVSPPPPGSATPPGGPHPADQDARAAVDPGTGGETLRRRRHAHGLCPAPTIGSGGGGEGRWRD
nr:uncharacterized protein LOC109762962 [Aegilops tauschii subsp. strangulata]